MKFDDNVKENVTILSIYDELVEDTKVLASWKW